MSRSGDSDIQSSIRGRGPDDPALIWELMHDVDASQRWLIDVDSLNAGLARLATSGLIRELPGHRYVDADSGAGSPTLTPITRPEWEAAAAEYHAQFAAMLAALPDAWPALRFRYVPAGGRAPTSADIAAARLAHDRVLDALVDAGQTMMAAGPFPDGNATGFWLATVSTRQLSDLEAAARPVFEAVAEPGSSLTGLMWDKTTAAPGDGSFEFISPGRPGDA